MGSEMCIRDSPSDVDEKFASGKAIMAFASRESNANVVAALNDAGVSLDDIEYIGVIRDDVGTCTVLCPSQ